MRRRTAILVGAMITHGAGSGVFAFRDRLAFGKVYNAAAFAPPPAVPVVAGVVKKVGEVPRYLRGVEAVHHLRFGYCP